MINLPYVNYNSRILFTNLVFLIIFQIYTLYLGLITFLGEKNDNEAYLYKK